MQLNNETHVVVTKALKYAHVNRHEYCVQEHILLFLFEEASSRKILNLCGFNSDVAAIELREYLDSSVNKVYENRTLDAVPGSLGFQKLLSSAAAQVYASGKSLITPNDVLVAFFAQDESHARYVLEKQGLTRYKLVKAISDHGKISALPGETGDQSQQDKAADFLINLNDRAKAGKIDNLIGRDHEIERVIQILCRRRKNNPILVGEPGVGKTAIAEGLALKIFQNNVPAALKDAQVLSLDIGSMMAGTKFRGDFEEKMKNLINQLKNTKNSILFIDEIHTIIGAGATSGGTLDTANMLKPLLTTGELRCLGSTTYKEYTSVFEKDAALARRFQKVDVVEPTVSDTITILNGLKPALEKHHKVKYSKDAIRSAVELSVKHINDRFLPDKAIDILDEAGSMMYLKGETSVTSKVIEKTIAKIARIPEKTVSTEEKSKLKGLSSSLKNLIYGQDEAIETVVSAIELSSSGLRSGEKPIGNFLFCGPTGVGKTELCKQLAHHMGVPFIRFDMSEYMEKHTVAKLIGAPPGYVGYEQAGMLTDAVRKNPHSIVLLDEIEKAHPDVWNILLQVMDHGTLTDNNGKKTDFKNTVIVLTSNVGAQEMTKRSLGLGAAPVSVGPQRPTKAIEQTFTPEFRNRLDAVVFFNPLGIESVISVLDKNLKELETQLKAKNVTAEFTSEVKEYLAKKGYQPTMGARPMARLIQDELKRPLSSEILYGSLESGGHVKVSLVNGSVNFSFSLPEKSNKKKSKVEVA